MLTVKTTKRLACKVSKGDRPDAMGTKDTTNKPVPKPSQAEQKPEDKPNKLNISHRGSSKIILSPLYLLPALLLLCPLLLDEKDL